jgi:hypothetical protein
MVPRETLGQAESQKQTRMVAAAPPLSPEPARPGQNPRLPWKLSRRGGLPSGDLLPRRGNRDPQPRPGLDVVHHGLAQPLPIQRHEPRLPLNLPRGHPAADGQHQQRPRVAFPGIRQPPAPTPPDHQPATTAPACYPAPPTRHPERTTAGQPAADRETPSRLPSPATTPARLGNLPAIRDIAHRALPPHAAQAPFFSCFAMIPALRGITSRVLPVTLPTPTGNTICPASPAHDTRNRCGLPPTRRGRVLTAPRT